jgi:hypothetical protein
MASGRLGLVIATSTIGVVLTVHGCNRNCESVSNGMHPDDVVKATVIGPYYVSDAGTSADGGASSCAGFDDLLSGTEVTWKANFGLFGEGCDCTETLHDLQIEAFNGQPPLAYQGDLVALVDAGTGCVGRLTMEVKAQSPDVSIFAPPPDAGLPPWSLQLSFTPQSVAQSDAGGCPIGPEGCTDAFVARATKQ